MRWVCPPAPQIAMDNEFYSGLPITTQIFLPDGVRLCNINSLCLKKSEND